jgi:hypothetical protein
MSSFSGTWREEGSATASDDGEFSRVKRRRKEEEEEGREDTKRGEREKREEKEKGKTHRLAELPALLHVVLPSEGGAELAGLARELGVTL